MAIKDLQGDTYRQLKDKPGILISKNFQQILFFYFSKKKILIFEICLKTILATITE